MKCCRNCNQFSRNKNFNFCPICGTQLDEIDDSLVKIFSQLDVVSELESSSEIDDSSDVLFLELNDTPPKSKPSSHRPEIPLSHDICLGGESIHEINGHFGWETRYIHDQRVVIHEKWGADSEGPRNYPKEKLEIPLQIDTEEKLRTYVKSKEFHWLNIKTCIR